MRRIVLVVVAAALALAPATMAAGETDPPEEFRAFWADAFNVGIYDQAQVDQLVSDATDANANALIVQIGRRFDCFCNDALYPRTDAAIAPAPYDPLAALLEAAHAEGLEVHAWVNATTLWNLATPPSSPDHAFNQHGPDAEGRDRWLARQYDGTELIGNNAHIDPGHPDAVDYVVAGIRSIVDNYDVDGINLDYIRYPDWNTTTTYSDWGYNETALARFQAATGRDDVPEPDDPEFSDWRRDQVTALVRRIYLELYEADPSVALSADTVTYAFGPQTMGSWEDTRPYAEVLQDWRGWMEEGILDLNVPMNYKRNWLEDQAQMYSEWTEVIADWQYDRQAIVGTAAYLNDIDDTVAQIREALTPTAAGNQAVGWIGYSYANPTQDGIGQPPAFRAEERAALIEALTVDSPDGDAPVFAEEAVVPERTWKTQPTAGHIAGDVVLRDGTAVDQVEGQLVQRGQGVATATTDGAGWFGFVDVDPGRYQVRVARDAAVGSGPANVVVEAGDLADAQLRPTQLR
jgi:uncharacterized lipoprotein YddW (UPF0748 family)